MKLEGYSYLFLVLAVTFLPFAILWAKKSHILLRRWKIILGMGVFSLLYSGCIDLFAFRWGAWMYGSEKILGVEILNTPMEDLLFLFLAGMVIASVFVVAVEREIRYGRLK